MEEAGREQQQYEQEGSKRQRTGTGCPAWPETRMILEQLRLLRIICACMQIEKELREEKGKGKRGKGKG